MFTVFYTTIFNTHTARLMSILKDVSQGVLEGTLFGLSCSNLKNMYLDEAHKTYLSNSVYIREWNK